MWELAENPRDMRVPTPVTRTGGGTVGEAVLWRKGRVWGDGDGSTEELGEQMQLGGEATAAFAVSKGSHPGGTRPSTIPGVLLLWPSCSLQIFLRT